jgi:hypothetical protein
MTWWYHKTRGVPFQNNTGETIPAFGCMAVVSGTFERQDLILTIRKPTAADISNGAVFVFNDETEVPDGEGGFAIMNLVAHALQNGALAVNATCGPVASSWKLSSSGTGYRKVATDTESDPEGMLVQFVGQGGGTPGAIIGGEIDSITTADGASPYNGLKIADVIVDFSPCDQALLGETVEVVDHSGCIFDLSSLELEGTYAWGAWGKSEDLSDSASPGDESPCHWGAFNRCCAPGEL